MVVCKGNLERHIVIARPHVTAKISSISDFIAQSMNLIYVPLSCESIVVRCLALGNGLGAFCPYQSKANGFQNVVLKRAYLSCVGF
jgi:hypothetical protein